jgi:hypothetical protein
MGGFTCCSARPTTYQGSQSHNLYNWLDDALTGNITEFMSTIIAAGFGPINIPFLSTVSALAGTTYAALAAVATVPLPTPFAVDILIANVPQRWFLVAGTYPGGSGTLQPNDCSGSQPKYWVQLE